MAGKITIAGASITNCGVGVSVPQGVSVDVISSLLHNNGVAVEVRDQANLRDFRDRIEAAIAKLPADRQAEIKPKWAKAWEALISTGSAVAAAAIAKALGLA